MVRDYRSKMWSSCHIIEEAQGLPYPLHLAASISVPFFMTFPLLKLLVSVNMLNAADWRKE